VHMGTRQLPRSVRHLSEGALEAAHQVTAQVTDLVEGSAAALARTAHAATGTRRRRYRGMRQLVIGAGIFALVVVASRWWARRTGPSRAPASPAPDQAAPVAPVGTAEPATAEPAATAQLRLA
jgi:hypothetical protein